MITLYGIANCDTIKKTRRWLNSNEVEYRFHDYRKDGSPPKLIATFLTQFDRTELINTRGTTWRNLPESTRANITNNTATKLMSSHPALIKRPLLHHGNKWLLGFDEARLHKFVSDNPGTC